MMMNIRNSINERIFTTFNEGTGMFRGIFRTDNIKLSEKQAMKWYEKHHLLREFSSEDKEPLTFSVPENRKLDQFEYEGLLPADLAKKLSDMQRDDILNKFIEMKNLVDQIGNKTTIEDIWLEA